MMKRICDAKERYMFRKRVVLTFPKDLVNKAIIYHLVKEFDLALNIMRAQILPDEEGKAVLELEGSRQNLDEGIKFLKRQGIHLELLAEDIEIKSGVCVNCGACVGICAPRALELNPATKKLDFTRSKCILCGLCENACPVKAIKVTF